MPEVISEGRGRLEAAGRYIGDTGINIIHEGLRVPNVFGSL